jgi:hypothetical protein
MSSAANISLLLAKNLLRDMPNAEQYLAKFFPPITLIFGLLATDAHALPAYWHVWRESALTSKRGEFPEVRVPTSSRIPSETARTQLDRLAKKGLIEIVSRRPGAAIRVRLKRLAPEMVLPPSDEWPWPLD